MANQHGSRRPPRKAPPRRALLVGMQRVDGPYGSVTFDGHVVEVVGGPRGTVTRLAAASLLEVVRQTDRDGNAVVLFFGRAGSASTRFPGRSAAELDALVAAVQPAR